MKYFSRVRRLLEIKFILLRFSINDLGYKNIWLYPINVLNTMNPWAFAHKRTKRAIRIRLALEALGPIYIKAGQILSTRRDLLPDDIADELAKLQDQVPPFPGELAVKIVEEALQGKISDLFLAFDLVPLASASIAQVHAAILLDGRSVIVKVLRPNIKETIESDLRIFNFFAKFAYRYSRSLRHFKPIEMVAEIKNTLNDELDLMREAANASQLRRNFLGSEDLYIPAIYWPYCRANILAMERIGGIPIYQHSQLKASGVNLKKLAERGIEIFFTQVFRDSFFHADMHPGNIFVDAEDPENPKYIMVDFGIVGSLNTYDQRYLAENMLAFFKRDYQRVAELHIASGWLPPHTRIDQFESAIRAVCEPILERPYKEISFGEMLLRLFQTARRFELNIQPQLILLQKTLLNIEGVSRQIYPDINLWEVASPFLEKWLKKQVGVKAFLRRVHENLPYWSEKLPEIPDLIYDILRDKHISQKQAKFSSGRALPHSPTYYFLIGVVFTGLLAVILYTMLN